MVRFYEDAECKQPLTELRFDDSYIEDIYGGVIENVVEIGSEVTKTIYMKNEEQDMVAVREISTGSPFIKAIVGTARLDMGDITPVSVTFAPTEEILGEIDNIEDAVEREAARRRLLSSDIKVRMYRVLRP